MKTLDLYKWIAGSMTDFTRPFQREDDEDNLLFNQAKAFWNKLENSGWVIILLLLVLGISSALVYYGPYNDYPGRRYKPIHWIWFLIGTFLVTFLLTLGAEYIMVAPKLDGAKMLEVKIALGNALYALILFVLTSFILCNTGFKTNAYRLFKI